MITSAKPAGDGYRVTYDDGRTLSVPTAPDNRHYAELQAWLEDGHTLDPEFTLDEIKRRKVNEINTACDAAIVAGFDSDALGSAHTYQSAREDQINLMGAAMGGQDMAFKCADNGEWAYRAHTGAQLQQVFAAGARVKLQLLVKADTLRRRVESAKTADEVDAVQW